MPEAASGITSQDPPPLLYESERLIYRGIEREDVDYFYSLAHDTEGIYGLSARLSRPNSRPGAEDVFSFVTEQALIVVMICLRPPEAASHSSAAQGTGGAASAPRKPHELVAIGHIMLMKPAQGMTHHRNCTLGIGMLKEYRGAGYGSEAIRWILDWGFRMANMHRIYLDCYGWNVGAAKLYKKLGFKLEETRREHIWYNGRWHDMLLFAILEDEWREAQQKQL